MGCRGKRVFKALFGALAIVGIIGFLLVAILETEGGMNSSTTLNSRSVEITIGREKIVAPPEHHLAYTSKRRIPNGPDPIHNRKAGKSRQPPGNHA